MVMDWFFDNADVPCKAFDIFYFSQGIEALCLKINP